MSKNEELWERIKQNISGANILTQEKLNGLDSKVIGGSIDQDDWKNLILRSLSETDEQPGCGEENAE